MTRVDFPLHISPTVPRTNTKKISDCSIFFVPVHSLNMVPVTPEVASKGTLPRAQTNHSLINRCVRLD